MEDNQRLTLDEMYDIFMRDEYKDFREYYGLDVKPHPTYGRQVPTLHVWGHRQLPLIYRHIVVEQLLREDYRNVCWESYGATENIVLLELIQLWLNPLTWFDPLELENCVVAGRVAHEVFDENRRYEQVDETWQYIERRRILAIADNVPVFTGEVAGNGMVKGMHFWTRLTFDHSAPLFKIMEGERLDYEEMRNTIKPYDAAALRSRLGYIAQERGGARAAELLRMLQGEWAQIKLWKTEFGRMTENEINEFETILMHGYDELLAEWERDKSDEVPTEEPNSPLFAVSDKMTYEMCEKELIRIINGSKNKAVACKEILRSAAVGYFLLSDKTDQEKADLINPWIPKTNKEYVFTRDDFRKARG